MRRTAKIAAVNLSPLRRLNNQIGILGGTTMKSLSLLVTATTLCIAATGCKSTQGKLIALPNPAPARAERADGEKIAPDDKMVADNVPVPFPDQVDYCTWTRESKTLQEFTVHFDYDSSVVKSEESPKIQKIAEYLKANPSNAICIEGHCDEKGTEEYNRSLGDRRALALREALAKVDVSPGRLDTISFSKDRPIDLAKTEAANSLNRRGEFVVLTPPK
jgi:peptidoglycan-associated lipoprotein